MRRLVVFGAGSGSREVARLAQQINRAAPTWDLLGFVDADPTRVGGELDGLPVLPVAGLDALVSDAGAPTYGCTGVMDPEVKQRIWRDEMQPARIEPASLVHPSVELPHDFDAGPGLVLYAGVNVSFDVRLGAFVNVLFGALLGHELRAGDFCTLLPGATLNGGCVLEERCLIGAKATLLPGVRIGAGSVVGVGSAIVEDVPPDTSIVSLPRQIARGRSREVPARSA